MTSTLLPAFHIAYMALLVLLGRKEEAREALANIEASNNDIVAAVHRGIYRIGSGDPRDAGRQLADAARLDVSSHFVVWGDVYLSLFAAYHAEMGNRSRADEILACTPPSTLNWVVWPYVWEWTDENFVESNQRRRQRELDRMSDDTNTRELMDHLLTEELGFWLGDGKAPA